MINFDTKNEGTWFYFDEDNHDAGGICLRELSSEEYQKIEKLTVKTKQKFSHGNSYSAITTNEELAAKMRWDYCIVNWAEVQIDGIEVECNTENKVKLSKTLGFIKFVSPCLEKLTETNNALEEARVKNSETLSDES